MSEDAHHDTGPGAKAAAPAVQPVQAYPVLVQAPGASPYPTLPQAPLAYCRCGLTPWPAMTLCACMAPPKAEEKKDGHKKPEPPPPAFSAAVPQDFPKRFEYVWSSLGKVLDGKAPPHGVIADARALLEMLLDDLDPDGRGRFVTEGAWIWRKTSFKTYDAKQRIHRLVEKRILLKPMKDLADRLAWTPQEEAARGVRGDPDLARRLVHLVWQVADQGFEQRHWSDYGEAPPRVAPPAAAHGAADGHGGGDGHH